MTDATSPEMTPEMKAELKNLATVTKRGFNLKDRLKNRGLRKGSITLYLDEEKGPELGWAFDVRDQLENVIGRAREGVVGEIDLAEATLDVLKSAAEAHAAVAPSAEITKAEITKAKKAADAAVTDVEKKIVELTAKRDELMAELEKTSLVVHVRAVPPIIQKDARRKAKHRLDITSKNIPDEKEEDFAEAYTAELMALVITSITDTETGETIEGSSYEDALDLMGYLPDGQYARLDALLGKIQFTDAISREIESQEDFS